MQGQGSNYNSFQGNLYLNGNPAANQQNVNVANNAAAIHNGQGQNYSRNHVISSHQFSGDHDLWVSSLSNQSGIGQRMEERHFLDNFGRTSLGNSGANNLHRNLDLNAAHHDDDNGPQLSLGLSRAAADQVPLVSGGSSSSAPVMIYSGIAEYVVEENTGGEGLLSDGRRRLLCKRRAPQQIPRTGQANATSGESSRPISAAQQAAAANSLSNRLNNSSSGFVSAQAPPPPTPLMDNFERNIRMRRTVMGSQHQNTTAANMWSTWNSGNYNSNVQAVQTTSTQSAVFSARFPQQPNSQWINGTLTTWAGGLSDNLREALIQEQSLRDYYYNNSRRNINMQQQQQLNLANNGMVSYTNNFGNNNFASSSRTPQLSYSSSARNQLVQRLQHLVNEGITHCPIHSASASSSAARDMDVSVRGGTARPAPRLGITRAGGGGGGGGHHSENPSQTAAQRRSRLVSEVRNALGLVRRGGAFRLEDVMVIDRSFLYGLPELGDTHDAMRLDVDNMSYEELLDLEEQIGNVSTGLTDEAILANLRRRKYQSITDEPTAETEPCCICQEDYANGEELGKLDCGHDFHFNCIKQWLVQKNSCPICKKTALAI